MISSPTFALLIGITLVIPGMTLADPGYSDKDKHGKGKKAPAAEVNEKFDALDQRLLTIEFGLRSYVAIDCSNDANSPRNATLADNTTYTLSGMCNGPVSCSNRLLVSQRKYIPV
jgi:hypothetical protein